VPVLQSPRETSPPAAAPNRRPVDRILSLQVPVIVRLAERRLPVSEVMRLGTGAIIEFFKRHDEPLELLINNKPIAVGETVKVGENFGLRISQIGDVKQIIQALGAARE
jgi:flagellar motor switch protein FliN/FliY